MLRLLVVLSLVGGSIGVRVKAFTLDVAGCPFAPVDGPGWISVGSLAVGFTIDPIAIVDISIGEVLDTLAVAKTLEEISMVVAAIGPRVVTDAVLNAVKPVASVNRSIEIVVDSDAIPFSTL